MLEHTYCIYSLSKNENDVNRIYHDTAYGFPIHDDNELFGRLLMEINQAGLSWTTILNKEENFRKAYSNFEIEKIANYNQEDIERLLSNPGIIRNKLKVNAAVFNAKQIITLKKKFGSFENWLDNYHPLKKEDWIKLFKNTFKFTGGEITNEFLMSTGYLKGAHDENCPIYKKIKFLAPKWDK